MIHDFNLSRKKYTTTAEWRTWKKSMGTLCDERKNKLQKPLGQWTLGDNKYITSWQ